MPSKTARLIFSGGGPENFCWGEQLFKKQGVSTG
jgi:hypothetical protein